MAKKLLAAGYVRDIQFDSPEELEIYLHQLDHRKQNYKVLETFERRDRTVIIRVLQQYNNAPLIRP